MAASLKYVTEMSRGIPHVKTLGLWLALLVLL